MDLNAAFDALQPLSYLDSSPTSRDWDFASLNLLERLEQSGTESGRLPPPIPTPSVRPTTPVPLPQSRSSSISTLSPAVTPTLPASWFSSTPPRLSPAPSTRRVSFSDLGRRYRVGDRRCADESVLSGLGSSHRDGSPQFDEDYEDLDDGYGEEDEGDDSEEDDGEESDTNSVTSKLSTTSHKRKSAKRNSTSETLGLIRALIEKFCSLNKGKGSNTLTKPPEFLYNGDAPKGGYFLETFQRLYGLYKAFVGISGEDCGLTFKNLITEDIEPTVRARLGLQRQEDWDSISNSDLIKRLKNNLGFRDKDYYLSQLEEFKLPKSSSSSSKIFSAFVTQTSSMLAIEAEAIKTGVVLRRSILKNLFQNYVRLHYRINQWFHDRTFKSLSKTVNHISKQYKKQHIQEKRKAHEDRENAIANSARSDFHGGKSEPANAADSRDAAQNKHGRGNAGRGRGGRQDSAGSRDSSSATPRRDDTRRQNQPGDSRARGGKGNASPRGGGIHKDLGQRDFKSAYALEDSMPKGRFWHEKTSFCQGDDCRARICQGCGEHSTAENRGHDRPHCPNVEHKDFVAAPKYFHEVWPGRKTALVRPVASTPPAKGNSANSDANS